MPKTKLCYCGEKSVPGLVPGVALCQYHFTARMHGMPWANWVHGRSACHACGDKLGASEGVYRDKARCTSCDTALFPEGREKETMEKIKALKKRFTDLQFIPGLPIMAAVTFQTPSTTKALTRLLEDLESDNYRLQADEVKALTRALRDLCDLCLDLLP